MNSESESYEYESTNHYKSFEAYLYVSYAVLCEKRRSNTLGGYGKANVENK